MTQGFVLDSRAFMKMESRRSFRVKDSCPLTWQWKQTGLTGQARIRNISTSGMLLEAKTDALLERNTLLEFASLLSNQALPALGRLVWSQPQGLFNRHKLWGVEFVDPAQDVVAGIQKRIQAKAARIALSQKMLDHVGWVLLILMTFMAAGVLIIQVVNYNNLVIASKMLLSSSAQQSALYRTSFDDYFHLKSLYGQTAQDLQAAKVAISQLGAQNHLLNEQMQAVKTRLKAENKRLSEQLKVVRTRLDMYEGKFQNMDQAQQALALNKDSLRAIKGRLHVLRREARLSRIAAQQERDRILLALGNQGWVIKDGKPFQPPEQADVVSPTKIRVDVEIMEPK